MILIRSAGQWSWDLLTSSRQLLHAVYLHIIAIREEYRGQGVGKALLDYSECIASEMADKFFLVVADYNPDAKRFYERNGYQQVGEIPNLYRHGITEYLMAKNLIK